MVQVGNELSNGLLWPEGKVPNYDNIAKFVNAGIRGVRAIDADVPIMIHLDNGGNNALYREWFDEFTKRGEDFQLIGLSYYPFWHGTLDMLTNNMNDIAERYGKELIIAEVSMGYTMEDYKDYEKLTDEQRKQALEKAAAARHARAELREQIKKGEKSLESVLNSDDPIASRMKVSTLIESLPGYGKAKAAKIMEELGISATRRVQGLGVRQREQLLEQLTK